ncbi:hypothetical protein MPSEU_000613300 [Mayamaea pseudoterrestris]|nr:hypothetical protein MPSEU_000613300 [Mayamaea pseudoterrestris]
MSLSDAEQQTARQVLDVLMQEKYKNKMYLFLQPLNPIEVPGYFELVPHQRFLDIQTVTANLNVYSSLADFWVDLQGIFENAIAYHENRESKWIAKMARDMLKVVRREKQKRQGGGLALPQEIQSADSALPEKKKKFSVKLKLPSKQNAAVGKQMPMARQSDSDSVSTASTVPAQNFASPPLKADEKLATKAKPTQPKLKLKLSLGSKKKKELPAGGEGQATTLPTLTDVSPLTVSAPVKAATTAPAKPKISLKLGSTGSNSRGKELPKGVAAAAAAPTSIPTSPAVIQPPPAKRQKKTKASNSATSSISASVARSITTGANTFPSSQALKILAGLRRRHNKSIGWFLKPVADKTIMNEYKAKVKYPSDISTMTTKIEKGLYPNVASMVLDLRRIFGNCLVYNTSIRDSLRPLTVEVMQTSEDLLKVFLKDYPGSYPPLLYCWKLCIGVLDTLYNLLNPTDDKPTALYFQHPVSYYCGGQFPPDYYEKVSKPMDFGTVTSNLIEGKYSTVEDFCSDCRLVLSNCVKYYNGRPDGVLFIEQANRLNELLSQQIEQLQRYVRSNVGAANQAQANAPVIFPKPPAPLLMEVLQELRETKYTDKATKISEPLMGPFEKPVSLSAFPDYMEAIKEPIDLSLIERRVKAGVYATPEDFEYDVNLIFKNSEKYYAPRGGERLVGMSKTGAKLFRKLFYIKMRAFEDPSSVPQAVEEQQNEPVDQVTSEASPMSASTANNNKPGGKIAPRISISAAQLSMAARMKAPSQTQKKSSVPTIKPDQPVPLHIAIARVKEAFPLRRQIKGLQPWEADCAKYFKELMRHPWISAARPTYIFHVPVPTLFPELREAYAAKVRKPMDLTTIECTLLAGNRYAAPEDFVADVALVFANAVRFNRDGKDVGDPLSCAYYDASIHLLRYSRWLSMELLAPYIEKNDHVDDDTAAGLPPFSWRLTEGNRKRAREEMEKLVFSEPIEKSLEGDRYTWQESECEKLLKSLRHQSDLRYMTFFLQPNYPADYTAYISKPMDWERVNRTLKKRHYDKFGDIISDLRLIFANALKYNGRLKGTDTVSGRAYESAIIMAMKLELAINKLLITVADRLERERIDHANAEREMEAQERADEARFFATLKKGGDAASADAAIDPVVSSMERTQPSEYATQKVRLVRRALQRRDSMDFETPNFDEEDDGKHDNSHGEVAKFQKAMFEKSQQELVKMRQRMASIGSMVYTQMLQRDLAAEWEETELKKIRESNEPRQDDAVKANDSETDHHDGASEVRKELEREGRERLTITFAGAVKRGMKQKRPAFSFE